MFKTISLAWICVLVFTCALTGNSQNRGPAGAVSIPKEIMLRIVKAEDERRWDADLADLLQHLNPRIRERAALAAGRIGHENSVPNLVELLTKDRNNNVRAMAAFALGETESVNAVDGLTAARYTPPLVRARVLEALGKIAGALPREQEAKQKELGKLVLDELLAQHRRRGRPDRQTVLLGLTAVLRSRPAEAGKVLVEFLEYPDATIRADTANTLARLRLKDGNDKLRRLLVDEMDPIVRANSARVLGATEDKPSVDVLLDRALNDQDPRVRVSAIRALAPLKESRAGDALFKRGQTLSARRSFAQGGDEGEVLEIATTLGTLLQGTGNNDVFDWLSRTRDIFAGSAPEIEIARARVSPARFLEALGAGKAGRQKAQETILLNWRAASSLAQGLAQFPALAETFPNRKNLVERAEEILRAMLDYRNSGLTINTLVAVHSEYAIPDVLRAFAAFKTGDLDDVSRKHLKDSDVIVRGTAADLLGELPPSESNRRALIEALPAALAEKDLNDAALSILDALAKQKHSAANDAIKSALQSGDHLVRRRAVTHLKANGVGDFSSRIGLAESRYTTTDYQRALNRAGKRVEAEVTTSRGRFTIAFVPDDAPLTVDNFIQLARRGYFNGIVVHRVVPNFVIQDGDPRGDGNGGPGYSIRCEINMQLYERAAVGMALSGKDTGGSQWFVTHSRQPHLDGGYTVFGYVVQGMNVVDNIARGDIVRSVTVREGGRNQRARGRN